MAAIDIEDDQRILLAHAMHLCMDRNLIWSSDFDAVRTWLGTYLQLALVTKPIANRDLLLAQRIIGLQDGRMA